VIHNVGVYILLSTRASLNLLMRRIQRQAREHIYTSFHGLLANIIVLALNWFRLSTHIEVFVNVRNSRVYCLLQKVVSRVGTLLSTSIFLIK
jgi:hypothetical protein